MAQDQDYGGIITAVIIVVGVVFSIVQAMLKGKNNTGTVFKPNKQADTNFIEFEDESMMVVDAQGNIIKQSVPKPPAPPIKNRRTKRPEVVRETVIVGNKATVCEAEYHPPGSYIDFIRTHAESAVIMHEILGKPKALQ